MKRGLTRKFTFLKSRIFEENMTLKKTQKNEFSLMIKTYVFFNGKNAKKRYFTYYSRASN